MDSEKTRKDELKKTFKIDQGALGEFQRVYLSSIAPMQDAIRKLAESFRVNIPKIEFPKIQFPKIDLGEFTKNLEEECKSNAKYGWCLSSEMPFGAYREIARTDDTQEVRDQLFVKMFEEDGFRLYNDEKRFIISSSSEEWRDFYIECFQAFEGGMLKAVIPSLISAIEHELASGIESGEIGKKLIRNAQQSFESKWGPTGFVYVMGASVISLLENGLFRGDDFSKPRQPLLNRNRVLHGRDNPSEWRNTDVYKLITIISAIQMFRD
ncbi:hypothetical protein [Paenibacillus woosongensis]|uniref:Uncharacterized protein n=1 Tax=Paenibacillus woosongensis TaxID=307580 RepID=A0A7X2Z109_9BACL|nr:hypothetical protein [Paenibacillus woosongensis]MUG45513.1 hypothetical protein [Paenibacillus woosongensis]